MSYSLSTTCGKGNKLISSKSVRLLDTQVSGHRFGNKGNKIGVLDCGNGLILKTLQPPPFGPREEKFYFRIFDQNCADPSLLQLRSFVPCFYGIQGCDDVSCLLMENISSNFCKPNILDIKIGQITYDPEASTEKMAREEAKFAFTKQLGFQITGMMIHDPESSELRYFDKVFARHLTPTTMLTDGLGKFFGFNGGGLRIDVLSVVLHKLTCIRDWFLMQRQYNFYASSILIVYGSELPDQVNSCHRHMRHDTVKGAQISTDTITLPHSDVAAACLEQDTALPPLPLCDICEETGYVATGVNRCEQKTGHVATGVNSCLDDEAFNENDYNLSRVCKFEHSDRCVLCRGRDPYCHGDNHEDSGVLIDSELLSCKHCKQRENCQSCIGKTDSAVCVKEAHVADVRMIDFTHAFPSTEMDNNYLFGLHKLISYVEQLLNGNVT